MSILYKIFNDSGLTALTNYIKTTRAKAVSNEAAIGGLGEDLAGLSGEVVTALDNKQNKLTFDTTPTAGSMNPVTSGGVKNYVDSSIVQSDLSQTDNTAKDYVKGVLRTEHLPDGYPHKEMTTILDGTFEFADTDGLYTHQITDENFNYTDGKSYTVIWDGATYRCVATKYSGLPILGNLAIAHAGSDTGEPFLFIISGTNKLIYTNGTAATHTVTVCKEIIHPIAEEFLPEIAIENGMVFKNLQAAMPSSEQWCSVTYGNGKFVAVANGSNGAAYSEDGVTWTITSMTKYGIWKSVTYGNGKFVTLNWNNSHEAFYSEDGITWTAATLPSYAKWYSVTYGNGKFVAVAENSTNAVYSEDGITWTATTLHSSVTTWQSVTYGNGKFVAVSDGSAVAYSYDGVTWTETALPNSVGCSSVTYGNDKFVAIVPYSIAAFYSNDGITWTETSMPTSAYWTSVTYGNGKFVAVVSGSTVTAYSKDGITWKTELKLISQNGKDVTADTLIALEHTHEASKISAGTFAGQVVANASGQTPGTMLVRNSKLVSAEETPTVNGEICWVYS